MGAMQDPSNELVLVQLPALEVKFLAAGSAGYSLASSAPAGAASAMQRQSAPAAIPASRRENGNRVMGDASFSMPHPPSRRANPGYPLPT
jgi:hypothetical protein